MFIGLSILVNIPQIAESYQGFLLLNTGRLFCEFQIGPAGAGQGAVWGALKVLWWLLAVPVLGCSQGVIVGAGYGAILH